MAGIDAPFVGSTLGRARCVCTTCPAGRPAASPPAVSSRHTAVFQLKPRADTAGQRRARRTLAYLIPSQVAPLTRPAAPVLLSLSLRQGARLLTSGR